MKKEDQRANPCIYNGSITPLSISTPSKNSQKTGRSRILRVGLFACLVSIWVSGPRAQVQVRQGLQSSAYDTRSATEVHAFSALLRTFVHIQGMFFLKCFLWTTNAVSITYRSVRIQLGPFGIPVSTRKNKQIRGDGVLFVCPTGRWPWLRVRILVLCVVRRRRWVRQVHNAEPVWFVWGCELLACLRAPAHILSPSWPTSAQKLSATEPGLVTRQSTY